MDAARCARCDAVIPGDAPWCSLCFEPVAIAPVSPPVPAGNLAAAVGVARSLPASALTQPMPGEASTDLVAASLGAGSTPTRVPTAPGDAAGAGSARPARSVAAPSWPCLHCGSSVAIDLSACPTCGTAFLALDGSAATVVRLPLIGRLDSGSRARTGMIAGAIGLGLAIILVGLAWGLSSL